MEGTEAIIKRIINDATDKGNALIESAKTSSDEKIYQANEWAEEYIKTQKEMFSFDAEEIVRRRLTVADLDVRKIVLNKKREIIEEVLTLVYKKLCSLKKGDYLSLVEKMLCEYAEKGDVIVISKDNVLSREDILNLDVCKKLELKINGEIGDFVGGVKLIGKVCDKDLTFLSLIDSNKQTLDNEIAEKIF